MKTLRSFSSLAPGSERVLELFVSKWAIRIIRALDRGTKRHGELRRSLGASQKMLTQTLRDLERAGLVPGICSAYGTGKCLLVRVPRLCQDEVNGR
jgi:DNA-binding HxlR family transcriptional regulator